MASSFDINGRFLSQPITGVQRYAREVTAGIEVLLCRSWFDARILLPRNVSCDLRLNAIKAKRVGPSSGHLWEQGFLPCFSRSPLINFCNLAPLVKTHQILCIHDANIFLVPDSYGARFRRYYRVMLPLLARRIVQITTVSEYSARMIARYLPVALRDIVVLPDGHEHVHRWDKNNSNFWSENKTPRQFILLLGSRARHKNTNIIVGLAEELDRIGLDIYVVGVKGSIFASERSIGHRNVRWLGYVSDDDLSALFQRALCFVFPSLTEGFGIPLLEAMALGCPVVSSDRASMPEVCAGAALMAGPERPEVWLAHIKALAGSESLRTELRQRGLERAAQYSWVQTAQRYLELVKQI